MLKNRNGTNWPFSCPVQVENVKHLRDEAQRMNIYDNNSSDWHFKKKKKPMCDSHRI